MKRVSILPKPDIPYNANIISTHVIYKIKINVDNYFKLKARIAPHGNEKSIKMDLKSEWNMCFPLGLRIVLSMDSPKKDGSYVKPMWNIPFYNCTGSDRRICHSTLRKCGQKTLLVTTHSHIWSCQRKLEMEMSIRWSLPRPRINTMPGNYSTSLHTNNGKLVVLAANIVDDMLVTGEPNTVNNFSNGFN